MHLNTAGYLDTPPVNPESHHMRRKRRRMVAVLVKGSGRAPAMKSRRMLRTTGEVVTNHLLSLTH